MSTQEVYTISLLINENNQNIELNLRSESDFSENYVLEIRQAHISPTVLSAWFFSCLKSLLLRTSPDSKIIFEPMRNKHSSNPLEAQGIWPAIEMIVQKTQEQKRKWQSLTPLDFSSNHILFIGEDLFVKKYKKTLDQQVFIHKLEPKLDLNNGEFNCFNTEQLLEIVQSNKIKFIHAVGPIFFWQNLILDNVYIPAVLKWMGVELTISDCDNYNESLNGYFKKLCFSFENSKRLSILPQIDKPWDELLKIPSVRYYSLHDPEPMEAKIKYSHTPSKLIFTSHSRIPEIRTYLKPALLLLEYADEKNILHDFQLLFHTLDYLLHNNFKATLIEKMELSFNLSKAFYNAVNLMKYEVLENLDSTKKIEVYGDGEWSLLFPQYYQGRYLSHAERDQLVLSGNYTYIVPAFNFSYYANNPLYGEVFNLNCPYVCFPSIVPNDKTAGLKHFEFSNMPEMNQKISQMENILTDFKNEILISRQHLKEVNELSLNETKRYLFSNEHIASLSYEKFTENMLHDFKAVVKAYFSQHSERILECFNRFVKKDFETFNPLQSKLSNRKYLNTLLNLKELKV